MMDLFSRRKPPSRASAEPEDVGGAGREGQRDKERGTEWKGERDGNEQKEKTSPILHVCL